MSGAPGSAADGGGPWSERFLERVESFGTGLTASAVREAARTLAVDGPEVGAGSVRARVADPSGDGDGYEVWFELPVFDGLRWTRAEQALNADAEAREQLLDGEFPDRTEAVFARAGLSLLPARARDLVAECPCPQWSSCVHLAAALGTLAAAFDADPFLLLRWRGRTRERLLRHLRELRAAEPPADAGPGGGTLRVVDRPLTECLEDFWREGDRHRLPAAEPDRTGPTALAQLGPSGILVRGRPLESLLEPAYRSLTEE